MNKFWRWVQNKAPDDNMPLGEQERTLFLDGAIAEDDPWFDDEVTPAVFKDELGEGKGPITLWINSPGGDVFAAAQIYNMLLSYPGRITVKIDGLAASAASVIAMAGDEVLVSPVSMLMIHNPSTLAMGDRSDMEKAISMLDEIKESIINAYMNKTGLSRKKLSDLMDAETWMNAKKAVELGFADAVMTRSDLEGSGLQNVQGEGPEDPLAGRVQKDDPDRGQEEDLETGDRNGTNPPHDKIGTGYLFQTRALATAFLNKVEKHRAPSGKDEDPKDGPIDDPENSATDRPIEEPAIEPGDKSEGRHHENPAAELQQDEHLENKGNDKAKDKARRVEDLMARLDLIHSLM